MHAVLFLALAPQRRADVPDPHRLGDRGTPTLLELRAERGLPAAGLAGDEYARDGRGREVDAPLGRELDQVRSVRRRDDDRLGLEPFDREQQAVGVPGADGM